MHAHTHAQIHTQILHTHTHTHTRTHTRSGREGKNSEDGPATHVRGLCLATVYTSVPSIVRTPGDLFVCDLSVCDVCLN